MNTEMFSCSFCLRSQDKVKWLIVSTDNKVYICDNCIEISRDIIARETISRQVESYGCLCGQVDHLVGCPISVAARIRADETPCGVLVCGDEK